MFNRLAVCALAVAALLVVSNKSLASLSVTLDTATDNGDEYVENGVYDSSDSGTLVDMRVTGTGGIGSQTSTGGSTASTGPFNLSYSGTSIIGSASSSATVVPSGNSAVGQGVIQLHITVNTVTPFTITGTLGLGSGRLGLSSVYIGDTTITAPDYGQLIEEQ